MKNKYETKVHVLNLVKYLNNLKPGKKIIYFQTDKGTEFIDNKLVSELNFLGIQTPTSVAGKHTQNGFAESHFRRIQDEARCLQNSAPHIVHRRFPKLSECPTIC